VVASAKAKRQKKKPELLKDIPDPTDGDPRRTGRCRILDGDSLCAVPYNLVDLDPAMIDEHNEVLLVEIMAFGQPGWFSDRAIAYVLQGDRKIPMEKVRNIVNQKVNMTGRQTRILSRAIYSLCSWNDELLVTLIPSLDL
jgi:hypothetical protein